MQLARSLAQQVKRGGMKREDAVKQLSQAGNPMARTTLKWLGA
jgi:DNA-binding phage protein